ncbi:MAG TPA: mechanosensitive ion channel family protein [Fibrobacteria bacterium]|nr:mechanosensitive ion channel family protein [Fibrobacteria bacterium]
MRHFPDTTHRILGSTWLGNSLQDYLVCLLAIAVGVLLVKLFHVLVMRRVHKWVASTASTWDDFLAAVLESNALPALYLLVVWHGVKDLYMKDGIRNGLRLAIYGALLVLAVRAAMALVNEAVRSYWRRHAAEKTAAKEKSLGGIITIAKVVVWVLGGILLLDNLGIKVSAFVAGLGITGIAVALAAQTILGDLFGYFVIFFDQPFEVGQVIKVGNFIGEVEAIGLKTTRLRSLSGEQVVLSNKYLTDSQIQNFKRMARRRAVFTLDVEYGTPEEALRGIPELVKKSLTAHPDVTFDRAHFQAFVESGLRFEVVYFVESPDYLRYMDIQQTVNFDIYRGFLESGIQFAFPSRTLYMRKEGGEEPVPPPPAGST